MKFLASAKDEVMVLRPQSASWRIPGLRAMRMELQDETQNSQLNMKFRESINIQRMCVPCNLEGTLTLKKKWVVWNQVKLASNMHSLTLLC